MLSVFADNLALAKYYRENCSMITSLSSWLLSVVVCVDNLVWVTGLLSLLYVVTCTLCLIEKFSGTIVTFISKNILKIFMKIGLFYGSSTCYTEMAAEKIRDILGEEFIDLHNVQRVRYYSDARV